MNFLEENQIHRNQSFFVTESPSVSYGYIIDILVEEEEEDPIPARYLPVVALEYAHGRVTERAVPLRMSHTPFFLSQNYGSPQDLIGLRVRIDYFDSYWYKGICTIVEESTPSEIGGGNSLDGAGFRFAPPGVVE